MKSITAFFASMAVFISALFAGTPHNLLAWDKPTQTITDTAQVLKLYQDAAAKNTATKLRERVKMTDALAGQDSALGRFVEAWGRAGSYAMNPQVSQVIQGVPGAPKNLKASDLVNAKAQYYHKGKTIVISFGLKDQLDKYDGTSNNKAVASGVGSMTEKSFASVKVQVQRLGYTLKTASMQYTKASVMVRIDAATGKIVKCSYTYNAQIIGERNEADVMFKQNFVYTVKLP